MDAVVNKVLLQYWKPKRKAVGNQQPSQAPLGARKVQRLSRKGVVREFGRSASHPAPILFWKISKSKLELGDDIVHPLKKLRDTCKE